MGDLLHASARPPRLVAGFESTYAPLADVDCFETTGHAQRWHEDLAAVRADGVTDLRYPLRWHRIEREPGRYDWSEPDAALGAMRDLGLRPVVDLVHHTSYPGRFTGGFADPRFGRAYERFAAAVAERYPWIEAYTLFNEPFATLFLAGHEALWPPYGRGLRGFAGLLRSVLPAVVRIAAQWRQALPAASHVWVDTCEHHAGDDANRAYIELANDRRFAVLDLALGERLDVRRPFLRDLVAAGGADLLELHGVASERMRVDLLGLDYYPHSEWWYDHDGPLAPSPAPVGFAEVARQYAGHTGLPLMLSETNIRGLPTDQVTWLRVMLLEYERALAAGVPLDGFCWFPQVDSCDWDSLLARGGAGRRDPVGVVALGPDGARVETAFTRAWRSVAAGARAGDLPAYRLQSPAREQLAGYEQTLRHWPWVDPPLVDVVPPVALPSVEMPPVALPSVELPPAAGPAAVPTAPPSEVPMASPSTGPARQSVSPARQQVRQPARPQVRQPARRPGGPAVHPTQPARPARRGADLVVLSHLRWQFVWQRPQHLITRLTAARAADGIEGGRTWFVEEPHATPDADAPRLATEQHGDVTRVWLEVPVEDGVPEGRLDFGVPAAQEYVELLAELLAAHGAEPAGPLTGAPEPPPHVWLYTPMALDMAEALQPDLLVYDVMDDLSAFANAPAGLRLRQRRALRLADVVLAGGRTLHAGVAGRRPDAHLFPSGVETAHYARSRTLRKGAAPGGRPVAGFVGVIDERLDAPMVAEVARLLPGWDVQLVGPVADFKMDPATLPQGPNVHYAGQRAYDELPAVMAGFDVAIMPFALNEATRSISPTKTLEYLAAGLPVVSTPVPDVVADFSGLVSVAATAEEFAAACERALGEPAEQRDRALRRIAHRYEWDGIAASVHGIMQDALSASEPGDRDRPSAGVTA